MEFRSCQYASMNDENLGDVCELCAMYLWMKNDYKTLAEYVLYFTRSAFLCRYLQNTEFANFQGSM